MKVGIVGVGRIGAGHAEVLAQHPDVSQLVVADANADAAAAVAAKVGGRVAASYADLLDSGIDAVAIATATNLHAEMIEAAVAAGVPTFSEKPIALDPQRTLEIVRLVRSSSVPVQIGFQRRFDPGYQRARDAVRDGVLGDLRRVHMVSGDQRPPHAEFFPTSGGMFRDLCIHDIDLARFVTGHEVATVIAVGANRGASFIGAAGDIDETVAIMIMDDQTLVTMHGSRYNGGGYDIRMELAGTDATLVVGLDARAAIRSLEDGVAFPAGTPYVDFRDRFGAAYIAEIGAFLEVVAGRTQCESTVEDALHASYIAEALDRSRREARAVQVAEVFLD